MVLFLSYSLIIPEILCKFVLPWQTEKILTYDLEGDFKGEIPLPYFVAKGKISPDLSKNEITVMTFPLKDERVNVRPIWVQDTLGNVKHSIESDPHFVDIPFDFSNELNSGKSGDELIYALINASNLPDTLYHYNSATNKLTPKVNIYIKDLKPNNGDYSKVVWNSIYELPEFYICNVAGTVQTAEGWYQGEQGVDFMVFKDDLRGGGCTIVNDYLADEKVAAYMFSEGGDEFATILDSDYFLRAIKEAKDENVKKRLQELSKNIDPEGNDILIIGKYKK
ncbi:MAG: hypothetical protein SNJ29_11275 [Rikenellaceae bacterium]